MTSLLPTAPGLDEPLEILEACHGRIAHQLQTLERLQLHLRAQGSDVEAQQAAAAILHYFNTAGRHHHADEESDLFPCLLGKAETPAALRDLIAQLLTDHQAMEAAWQQLEQELKRLTLPGAEVSVLQEETVSRFVGLYRQHLTKENELLLPAARKLLVADDIQHLGQAMAARRGVRLVPGLGA